MVPRWIKIIEAQRGDDFCITIFEQFHGKTIISQQRPSGIVGLNNYLYLGGVLYKDEKFILTNWLSWM
mgnify:CR=1 FL=1